MKAGLRNGLLWGQTALIVLLAWAVVYLGRDEFALYAGPEDDEVVAASRVDQEGALPVVRVDAAGQAASGIETRPLAAAEGAATLSFPATVVAVQPLLDWRARRAAQGAEVAQARAAAAASEAEYRRSQALFEDDRNVSQKALQAAEARWRMDQAQLQAAEAALRGSEDQLRAAWGEGLRAWLQRDPAALDRLARQQDALLLLTLRPAEGAPAPPEVRLDAGPAGALLTARLLAAAPVSDPQVPGRSFFYHAPAANLPAGMRLAALAPRPGQEGTLVPAEAVVWHGGKPWLYLRRGGEEFLRRELAGATPAPGGWFVPGLPAGERAVVAGAQLLLSEELRYQIKNENED